MADQPDQSLGVVRRALAAKLGLALGWHKQIATWLAAPKIRAVETRGDHAFHHDVWGAHQMT
jgi:hypothetical protein